MATKGTCKFVKSEDLEDMTRKIAASLSIGGSYEAFSASVKTSTEQSVTKNKKQMRIDNVCTAIDSIWRPEDLWSASDILESVKEAFLTRTPAEFAADFGAFYPKMMTLGAMMRYSFVKVSETTETSSDYQAEITAKANELLASASASAAGSSSKKIGSSKETTTISVATSGGDPAIMLGSTAKNYEQQLAKWRESVDESNLYPMHFELGLLTDLLMDIDPHGANELAKYYKRIWGDSLDALREIDSRWPAPRESKMFKSGWSDGRPNYDGFQHLSAITGLSCTSYCSNMQLETFDDAQTDKRLEKTGIQIWATPANPRGSWKGHSARCPPDYVVTAIEITSEWAYTLKLRCNRLLFPGHWQTVDHEGLYYPTTTGSNPYFTTLVNTGTGNGAKMRCTTDQAVMVGFFCEGDWCEKKSLLCAKTTNITWGYKRTKDIPWCSYAPGSTDCPAHAPVRYPFNNRCFQYKWGGTMCNVDPENDPLEYQRQDVRCICPPESAPSPSPSPSPECTPAGSDPYGTDKHVDCCSGLTETLKPRDWDPTGVGHYECAYPWEI